MDGYKARLVINGEQTEGEGEISFSDGKTTLSATFPDEEIVKSVVFVPEEEACFLEKRGELTFRARFVSGEESVMVCETPYGEMEIPVWTMRYRHKSTENKVTLWLSYVLPYCEVGGDAEESAALPLDRAMATPGRAVIVINAKDEEVCGAENGVFGGKEPVSEEPIGEEPVSEEPDGVSEGAFDETACGAEVSAAEEAAEDSEEAVIGEKITLLFTLEKKIPVC